MKLTLLIVSCLLFAAVQSAAVDLDSAHDAELSLMERAAAQAPTKEDVKAILKQAEIDLQAAINEVDESDPVPVVSTGEKRSASPGWTLDMVPIGKRSPSPGDHRFGASVNYGPGGWSGGLSYTYSFGKRSAIVEKRSPSPGNHEIGGSLNYGPGGWSGGIRYTYSFGKRSA